MSIDFVKAPPNAIEPLQLTPGSVGSDLFSTQEIKMLPFSTIGVPVSLNLKIPIGHMGLLTGKSGLALKNIHTHVGTIDCDFFGEMNVILTNLNSIPYKISNGDRLGQIILIRYLNPRWVQSSKFISDVLKWKESDFSEKHAGFGSTGK